MSDLTQVEIRADAARATQLITLDEWIDMEEGKARAIRDVLSRFVVDKATGGYMDGSAAKKLLGGMTMEQILKSSESFRKAVDLQAVPLASGSV